MTDSEQTLRAIIGSAGDAIISGDANGDIITWNPAAERIFGWAEAEAVGHSLTLIIPEEFHARHQEGHARVVASGETRIIGQTVQVAGLCKDGTRIPVELSLETWVTDGERFFTGIIRDVSEQARLISALTDSESRLEAIVDTANDAIITIDSEGHVLLWNQHAEEMFGRGRSEMVGRPLDAIIPKQFQGMHHAGIERVVGGGETHAIGQTVELLGLRRDGHEFPMEMSLATWGDGDERYFSGIIRDITERKEAEKALFEAHEALAQKNEMLESLSAKLAKYLSRQVYESIFEGRTEVKVASYRKKLTVFFSDIQGFTELTDRMEPEPLSQLLNRYLSDMSDIALEHGGTVDKFIGDGIMIFYGDPETRGESEDAKACARMAIRMRDRISDLKNEWQRQSGAVELHVRMGITTGYCTVGNFGSEDRLDYTIVGKQVNAAARLESSAQADQIQISHDTYELIKDEVRCERVGEIQLKGLAYPMKTYGIVGLIADEELSHSPGFSLEIDASKLNAEEAEAAREALRRALDELD